jgi:hypothetical protein
LVPQNSTEESNEREAGRRGEKKEKKGRKRLKARGLDYEHMIKARAHKGGVRIGKTPKKLANICCP